MPMTLEDALTTALDDEYAARATYRAVLDAFGDVRPFVIIVESEERHIQALTQLCERYGVEIPVDHWPGRVSAPESVEAACEAGVEGERANAALYEELLGATEGYPDVEATFRNLSRASQENHLPAFERCVRREQGHGESPGGTGGRHQIRRRRHRGGGGHGGEDG